MRVSAILVNYRRAEMTAACVASVYAALEQVPEPTEIVIVDNGSGDGSAAALRAASPGATLVELPANRGFAEGACEGIERSSGEWVAMINNDVLVEPGAIAEMLRAGAGAPDIGAVAAQMRFAGAAEAINSAGIVVDRLGIARDRLLGEPLSTSEAEPVEVFGASAGACLYRRRMLNATGGIDPTFFFSYDDVDLAWRARMAGWRSIYAPAAVVHHHHGATGAHGSDLKYYHVGLNRVRTLAKNADARQLFRYGAAMVAYDAAYVAYAAATDRTLAPLRGRLQGLREWRHYRRQGRPGRRPVPLDPVMGARAALRRRAVWQRHSGVRA